MPQWILSLLERHYDELHGVINSRPVVDAVIKESSQPFRDLADTFDEAPVQLQLPVVDAMRALAAAGYCTVDDAPLMIEKTATVAENAGTEEFFKTINAMVVAQASAPSVVSYALSLLQNPDEFQRRVAFYAVASVSERRTATIPDQLRFRLRTEAEREPSEQRRLQFLEVLSRL